MSNAALNDWGTVAAVIGTAASIPVFIAWFRSRLPKAKLPALVDLMTSTQGLFVESIRDGFLTNEIDIYQYHLSLWAIKICIGDVCADVDDAKTWQQNVRNWYNGLSGKIDNLQNRLTTIRARLSRVQSAQRRRLAAAGQALNYVPSPALQDYLTRYGALTTPPPLPMTMQHLRHIPACNELRASSAGVPSVVPTNPPCNVHPSLPPAAKASTDPSTDGPPTLPTGSCPCSSPDSTRRQDSTTGEPSATHYVISGADLKSLLSVRLVPVSSHPRSGVRRQRTSRRAVLLQFGKQLFRPDTSSSGCVEAIIPRGRTEDSVTKASPNAIRHTDAEGARSHATLASGGSEGVDLEAQVRAPAVDVGYVSDSESGDWSDV